MAFPVDVRYVREAEQKLGVRFPVSFVKRMLRNNGGEVQTHGDAWQLFPFFDTSDRKRLKRTCNDIVRETQGAQEQPHFPTDAVAIGSNGSGDYLVLLPLVDPTDVLGPVYWWDHETGELNYISDDIGNLAGIDRQGKAWLFDSSR